MQGLLRWFVRVRTTVRRAGRRLMAARTVLSTWMRLIYHMTTKSLPIYKTQKKMRAIRLCYMIVLFNCSYTFLQINKGYTNFPTIIIHYALAMLGTFYRFQTNDHNPISTPTTDFQTASSFQACYLVV